MEPKVWRTEKNVLISWRLKGLRLLYASSWSESQTNFRLEKFELQLQCPTIYLIPKVFNIGAALNCGETRENPEKTTPFLYGNMQANSYSLVQGIEPVLPRWDCSNQTKLHWISHIFSHTSCLYTWWKWLQCAVIDASFVLKRHKVLICLCHCTVHVSHPVRGGLVLGIHKMAWFAFL